MGRETLRLLLVIKVQHLLISVKPSLVLQTELRWQCRGKIYQFENINMKNLTIEDKCYIAGFLDGDGSIFAQIVRGKDYKYLFRIRVSIGFYQKKDKYWFILKLKKLLGYGYVRIRKDNVTEYVITGANPVERVLRALKNHVIIKKKNVNLMLEIIEK